MKKKSMGGKVVIAVVVIILLALAVVLIMRKSGGGVIEMKNQSCPVSGKPVDGQHSYTHEGKRYNLCSEGCAKRLSENPEKYTNQ